MNKLDLLKQISESKNPNNKSISDLVSLFLSKTTSDMEKVKGDKGDPGYSPIKGKDYYTEKEINTMVEYIQSKVKDGEMGPMGPVGPAGRNGETPIRGVDYWTAKDQDKILKDVLAQVPKPKDGISPNVDEVVNKAVDELQKRPVHFKDIKGTEQLIEFLKLGGFRGGGGSGSGGSSISLQTNGVVNGSQAILNLIAGTNITLTDNGVGGVTIDASGGGGAGTLAQTLALGNVTGGNDIVVSTGDQIIGQTDLLLSAAGGDNFYYAGPNYIFQQWDGGAGNTDFLLQGGGTQLFSHLAIDIQTDTGLYGFSSGSLNSKTGTFDFTALTDNRSFAFPDASGTIALTSNVYTNLTQFVNQTAWRVFYSDGSGDVKELALGANGTYLQSTGASAIPTWSTPAGSGDVVKVGTPVNNQLGVWTGDGTIEGDADLTFDTTTNILLTPNVTATTKVTSPLILGGTGVGSDLVLQTTSGVGTTGADMHFLVGNNGSFEALTIFNDGSLTFGNQPMTVNGNLYAANNLDVVGGMQLTGALNASGSAATFDSVTAENMTVNSTIGAVTVQANTLEVGGGFGSTGATISSAGVIQADGAISSASTGTFEAVLANSNDSGALGAAGTAFSDLFLAEGGVINWDSGDATITQTGNDITVAGITTFGVGTSTAVTLGTIELSNTDTTLSRSAAGVLAVEGVVIPSVSSANKITNKVNVPRTQTAADATSISVDSDVYVWSEQTNTQGAGTLTINNPTGTPTAGQPLGYAIKSTNAQTFAWGANFAGSSAVALPTTQTGDSKEYDYSFKWSGILSKWIYTGTAGGF